MNHIRLSADLQQRIVDSLVSLQPAQRPPGSIAIPFDRIMIARPSGSSLKVSLSLGAMTVGEWDTRCVDSNDTLTVTGVRGYYDLNMDFHRWTTT